jgi:hypothetical protein
MVIKKTREGDLNIKAAHRLAEPEQTMRSDFRVSMNTETPVAAVVRKPHKSMRVKERTTFEFQWMRIDFTVVQLHTDGRENPNARLDYECEVEIADVNYLI